MEDIKDTKSTVALSPETKEQLATFGKKGESFDIILQRVLKNTDTLCNTRPEEDDVEEVQE